jgi:OmpA-OmpF porin, OOP family
MKCQRHVVGLVLGLAAVGAAVAQTNGTLRWRAGSNPLGLQAGTSELRVPCGSFTFACADAASVPLYSSLRAPRSVSMQVGFADAAATALRSGRAPGLNVTFVGKAGLLSDLGVYGRVGTTFNRAATALSPLGGGDGGLTYGVGLSWDFSRSATAAVGLDSYDVRGALGDVRDVRTSLGLQWRY